VDNIAVMAILQEQHHKEMQELKGKMAEYSTEFAEKLEIQSNRHKKEIANMKVIHKS
jgi:hypothetical protein